jgi:putative glutamine amidotransferase
MPPRIAIPMPHSENSAYAERALPQYERAVQMVGGEPVRIPLDQTPAQVKQIINTCDAVLLPGSPADVAPAKYQAERHPKTEASDDKRDAVDELLLEDAYERKKPILAICYGLQILNVHRTGTLIQSIGDFLAPEKQFINHEAGRRVPVAHTVRVEPDSALAEIVKASSKNGLVVNVNSSHHQSAEVVGEGLRVVARCPADGVIEALEGTTPGHFVLAVQWHPERSVEADETSRAIFRALVDAASERRRIR